MKNIIAKVKNFGVSLELAKAARMGHRIETTASGDYLIIINRITNKS